MSKYGNENAAAGGRNSGTGGRDAQYGGGGGFGGGGNSGGSGFGNRTASVIGNRFGAPSASAQAAAATRNAPTNAPFAGQGGLNARRTVNPTPSYEMSLHNMYELSKMMPGVGLPARAGMAIAGYGPDFTGYQGQVNGPGDYDGPNRFGTLGSSLMTGQHPPMPGMPGSIGQPSAGGNPMMQQFMPGQYLSVGGQGLPSYGAQMPGYSYFGAQPGQMGLPPTPSATPLKPGGIGTPGFGMPRPGHTTGIR